MSFTEVGEFTVGPTDTVVEVGSFDLKEGDDTLWVEVQRTSPDQGWPWSYGILSWKSSFGLELGSCKAYASKEGEVYKLSVGRAPRSREGKIYYEPRSYNLAWIKKDYDLTLSVSARSGVTTAEATKYGGNFAYPVVGGSWRYASDSGLLRLKL